MIQLTINVIYTNRGMEKVNGEWVGENRVKIGYLKFLVTRVVLGHLYIFIYNNNSISIAKFIYTFIV